MDARIPMDSIAVIGSGDVWSNTFAEEIARMISPVRGVRVVPWQRVRAYARRVFSAEEIGREVNARCVAVCRVAATKTSVDLSIEIVDVLAERLAAEERFLTLVDEIFDLQERAARWLARFLCGGGARVAKPAQGVSAATYVAVLRAGECGPGQAIALLLAADDGSPLVARELARTVVDAPDDLIDGPAVAAARRAIVRAIKGWPRCAATRAIAAAMCVRFDHDWSAAEAHFDAARRLDPSSADAHAGYGLLLALLGRFEGAETELRTANALGAPFHRARLALGYGLLLAGQTAEAVTHFETVANETGGFLVACPECDPILRRLGIESKLSGDFTLNSLYPARICTADP
jgi:TolB-like protein